ncbi:MAG: bifunctional folylpolyglutamate synthase/dihydrofolate synthase [Bacteroidales bacterium]|nr:bifunctional folylpolyglutamate synthase/dihydrofolate synthase [Bacteroidales bacterium]
MNYEQTIKYLYSRLPVYQRTGASAYKEGLDNSLALDKYLNYPHRKYKTIHVGGTNGKGSTSHLLAAILQKAGYKTGLYTSPHLVDFRERIRVNGEMISQDFVVDFVSKHRAFSEQISPSFFELTMMMAFDYFAHCEVDVAIIEVGLGGRLDSTNIITPIVSVITNISFDHVQFLGDTLPKIATEKAGIIKKNVPVIIGEATGEVRSVFEKKAHEMSSTIRFAQEDNPILKSEKESSGRWRFETNRFGEIIGELGGLCQDKNAATVLATVEELIHSGFAIDNEVIHIGFSNVCTLTGLQGRWQQLDESPRIICDTAHNEGGIQYVVEQLSSEIYERLHIVLGMVNDKDIRRVLSLLPTDATYYFSKASVPRALNAFELQSMAALNGLIGTAYATVKEAILASRKNAEPNDLIFVGGSTFVVADALTDINYYTK